MSIAYSEKQADFLRRPFKETLEICEGTPRSGKTFAATQRYALNLLRTHDPTHMVVGYSAEQAYRLIMEGEGYGLIHVFRGCSEIKHDDTGAHLLIHTPAGDRKVYWKGGAKKDSKNVITGLSLGSVFLCEVNLLHQEMLQELIRRTFAATDRYMIGDLNPDFPNHPVYTDFFKRFEKNQDMYWTHWLCKDNPTLSAARLKQIEHECEVSPFIYKRDWQGLRTMPQGAVYFMFDSEKHILEELPEDVQKITMFFAGDGGTTDATSIGCYIVGSQGGKAKLFRVGGWYYDRGQKALSTQAREIVKDFVPYMRTKYGMREQQFFIDPACKALRLELGKEGIQTQGADNNAHDVKGSTKGLRCGIEMAQSALTDELVHFVEDDTYSTLPLVREFGLYCFDDNGNPVDKYNHCLAGDTIIDTVSGPIPIKDLVGKTGEVFCYDEKAGKMAVGKFRDVRLTRAQAAVYQITCEDGRTIKCTGDHPILTTNGWKRADALREGDEIMEISATPKYEYYDGVKFTRDDTTGYYLNSTIRQRIHRYVWEKEKGPIPEGYHVHHKDGDKSNNDIDNLELLEGRDHASYHAKKYAEENREEILRRMHDIVLPAAQAWHQSEAGRQHALEQYKIRGYKLFKEVEKTCEQCGESFITHSNGNDRFCSNACKSAWRRASGVDDVMKACEYCGRSFMSNKYSKIRYCSRDCAHKARRGTHYVIKSKAS